MFVQQIVYKAFTSNTYIISFEKEDDIWLVDIGNFYGVIKNSTQISFYETKKICICSATSIVLIVLFIISPLSNFFTTSLVMKILILAILIYTIYLKNILI
jgi:hypothetical protein